MRPLKKKKKKAAHKGLSRKESATQADSSPVESFSSRYEVNTIVLSGGCSFLCAPNVKPQASLLCCLPQSYYNSNLTLKPNGLNGTSSWLPNLPSLFSYCPLGYQGHTANHGQILVDLFPDHAHPDVPLSALTTGNTVTRQLVPADPAHCLQACAFHPNTHVF